MNRTYLDLRTKVQDYHENKKTAQESSAEKVKLVVTKSQSNILDSSTKMHFIL